MKLTFDKTILDREGLGPVQYGELGLFSADLGGVGGNIKETPEDFEVEEITSYEPCGEGEHLFIWIEKRMLSADELLQQVASALEIPFHDIGMAGKKDRNAVTRQYISVPREAEPRLKQLNHSGIRVLSTKAHGNKLSVGHVKGNRFRIVVRDLTNNDPDRIDQITERIQQMGFPNFFGLQRFGSKGDTADIGFRILNGDDEDLPRYWRSKGSRKFALSAAQSYLFNRYLLKRLVEKGNENLLAGDVVFKTTGGIFRVEDLAVEQERYRQGEIVPAGPIFGKKTYLADKEALAFEDSVLEEAGLERERFSQFGKRLMGTRRAIVCHPQDFSVLRNENHLTLNFTLPAGSYATVLLAEFMKPLNNTL